jgi:hypothetical protein
MRGQETAWRLQNSFGMSVWCYAVPLGMQQFIHVLSDLELLHHMAHATYGLFFSEQDTELSASSQAQQSSRRETSV